MCYGCFMNTLYKGGGYARTTNPSDVKSSLSKAAGVDAFIVVKTVRDLLYDPEKKAERAQMATSNVDYSLGNLFADVRCCITALVYLNTLGTNITCDVYQDKLAIEVLDAFMKEIEEWGNIAASPTFCEQAFVWYYHIEEESKKYLTMENLPQIILYQMSYAITYHINKPRETLTRFLERPFVKYCIAKNPEHYLVKTMLEKAEKFERKNAEYLKTA